MDLCQALCVLGREHIVANQPPRVAVLETKSTAVDVVTQMDKDVEALLRGRLAELRPMDGFLGEEGQSQQGSSGLTWVVDPIDGTVNYLYGRDAFTISVAVVSGPPVPGEWEILAGAVIHVPYGTLWSAGKGMGAWSSGARLRVNQVDSLESSLLATGFAYSAQTRKRQALALVKVLPVVRDIRRVGSAALDLCHLAQGLVDVYYEEGLNAWDMAAGILIAREAGAEVCGLNGEPEGQKMTIAGPKNLTLSVAQLLSE